MRIRRRLRIMMLSATIAFAVVACSGNKPETAPQTPAPGPHMRKVT